MQKQMRKILFTLIVAITLTCSFLSVTKADVTNIDKVVVTLRHPYPDLRLVAAHRGLWGGAIQTTLLQIQFEQYKMLQIMVSRWLEWA